MGQGRAEHVDHCGDVYVLCVSTPRITSSAGRAACCAGRVGWGMLVTVTRLLHRLGLMADAGPGGQSELIDGAMCGKATIGTHPPVRRQQAPPGSKSRKIYSKAPEASCHTAQAPAPGGTPGVSQLSQMIAIRTVGGYRVRR